MSFIDFCIFEEAHERAQDAAKYIEPSDTCGEPLFEAVWDIRISEVGRAGQRRQYDDRDGHVMVLSLVLAL